MRDSPRAWRSLLLRLLSFNLSARRVASLVTSSCHVIPSSLFGEQTCTRIPHMRRTHPRTCPDAGRFPPSMGSSLILQQLQGRTYVSQTRWQLQTDCVTALSNCLSREKRHSSTLLACFVFVDVTVTISPSIVTGESGENCAVMMIGDIDSVFGSPQRDMPQSLDDCCPRASYFCDFACQDFSQSYYLREKNGMIDKNRLKKGV